MTAWGNSPRGWKQKGRREKSHTSGVHKLSWPRPRAVGERKSERKKKQNLEKPQETRKIGNKEKKKHEPDKRNWGPGEKEERGPTKKKQATRPGQGKQPVVPLLNTNGGGVPRTAKFGPRPSRKQGKKKKRKQVRPLTGWKMDPGLTEGVRSQFGRDR